MTATTPKLYKLVALREVAPDPRYCDTPERCADYWRQSIATDERFQPDVEQCFVLLLNTRRRILGHHLVATGTLDTIFVHPRETFRAAIVGNASTIILMHNHPSGDPTPSEGDIKITRDFQRAGHVLKMDLIDHLVMGHPAIHPKGYASLRALGYFYS